MFLSRLSLFEFRNYPGLDLGLERSASVFIGGNAQGKTNLMEAVALVALARSPRTQQSAELVRFGQSAARVSGEVHRQDGVQDLEVRIVRAGEADPGRTTTRLCANGLVRTTSEMLGRLRVVLFWPDDLQLVKGSGEGRRRFLNTLISQLDPRHAKLLSEHQHALEQRNALLRAVREARQAARTLDYWTQVAAQSGAAIMLERQCHLRELQPLAAAFQRELSDHRENLELHYAPGGVQVGEATVSLLAEQLCAAMADRREEEISRGQTVVGPQRDDVEVRLDAREARLFASQGQQRATVLSLKLAELTYVAERTGEQPVLLLDDVMSELDPTRRERLLGALEPGPQALITACELDDLPKSFLERAAVYRVEAGHVYA